MPRSFSAPRWLPDTTGIVYAATSDYDGDGSTDVYGDAILLLDLATGEQLALLAPTPSIYVWEFSISPATDAIVARISHGGARNLLLLDYSSDTPVVPLAHGRRRQLQARLATTEQVIGRFRWPDYRH